MRAYERGCGAMLRLGMPTPGRAAVLTKRVAIFTGPSRAWHPIRKPQEK